MEIYYIRLAKALFLTLDSYMEINLSTHPDKRSDMLKLSDSFTVPQIFFNEEHIGGADELIALLEKWDGDGDGDGNGGGKSAKERYEMEVESAQDPTDERLQPSTKDAVVEVPAPPRSEEDQIQLPNSSGDLVSYLEMMQRLLMSMKTKTNHLAYRGKLYKNSITGQNLVLHLMAEFNLMKEEALNFGVYLNQRKLIYHVTNDHDFADRKDLYFRLQPHQNPNILNSYRVWTDRVDPNPLAVVSRLGKHLENIFDRALQKDDGNINLHSASKDPKYEEFEEEVCELQKISMAKMDKNYLTAFAINVYNLMIKYAQVKVGVPSTNLQRAAFFNKVKMNLGGDIFSFQELENGILRANALPPYALRKVFSPTDERLRLAVDKVDPRIHFGLNCGARSCPPVKKFSANDLNEELRIAALAFCEQDDNVMINESSNTLTCNTIFKWYIEDFAPSISELPVALLQFLKGSKKLSLEKMIEKGPIKVEFFRYDWGSNITSSKKFSNSNLVADQYSLNAIFCRSK